MSLNLRASVRAIILDEDDQVLLCRFVFPHPAVPNGAQAVWAAPGGGLEPGEDGLSALRRELREETGLVTAIDPPHVWHQVVVAADLAPGFDGMVNEIDENKGKIKVLVNMFGRETPVELDSLQVKKI